MYIKHNYIINSVSPCDSRLNLNTYLILYFVPQIRDYIHRWPARLVGDVRTSSSIRFNEITVFIGAWPTPSLRFGILVNTKLNAFTTGQCLYLYGYPEVICTANLCWNAKFYRPATLNTLYTYIVRVFHTNTVQWALYQLNVLVIRLHGP